MQKRDAMLNEAGYIVLRFTEIPEHSPTAQTQWDHAWQCVLELF